MCVDFTIRIPENYEAERLYAVSIIFDTFLGVKHRILVTEEKNYIISFLTKESIMKIK